jgi:uncharacterized membrane protein YuzA (DUF378 family)
MTTVTRSRRRSASRFVAAVLTGLVGFLAFNVVDGVFGLFGAIIGLAACIAMTVFVFRRAPAEEEPHA